MRRRHFIRHSTMIAAATHVPLFLKVPVGKRVQRSPSGKILIVVQLSGGNDGLNAIVPFEDDLYYRSRPEIAIPPASVLKLDRGLGLGPGLEGLAEVYDSGELAIINSVGYPNPNRSHFRSMDIWHTAALDEDHRASGWIGRYLDSACHGCEIAYHAIELGDGLSTALKGQLRSGFAMRGPEKLRQATANTFLRELGKRHKAIHEDHHLSYLYKTMVEVQESAAYLTSKINSFQSKTHYPAHTFGHSMKQIAELIIADTDAAIYYVSLPGFDTHVQQKPRQQRLLRLCTEALLALRKDLKQHGLFDDTLVLVFSEFGRRVQENGSAGTDHGAANNVFLLGGKLPKPGIIGIPDLGHLDDGDLIYKVDFRAIYADILDKWLSANPSEIIGDMPLAGLL